MLSRMEGRPNHSIRQKIRPEQSASASDGCRGSVSSRHRRHRRRLILPPEMQSANEGEKEAGVTFSVCSFKCSLGLTHCSTTHKRSESRRVERRKLSERDALRVQHSFCFTERYRSSSAAALPQDSRAAYFALCTVQIKRFAWKEAKTGQCQHRLDVPIK